MLPTSPGSPTEPAVVTAADGAELAVWSAGSADAACVVLVHGFSLDHTTWEPVAERLVAAGYRIVIPDLRGHGRSTLGSAEPTAERLVQDVKDIAAGLDLPAFHLVGHSLGAVVALAARTSAELDGRVRSVTSVAGTEQSIQNPVMRLAARLFSSKLGIAMLKRKQPGRLMISTWFGKRPNPEQLDWIRTLSAQCPPDTRQDITRATADIDLRLTFATPAPPTLILVGNLDKATPAKVSKRIAAAIDGARLAVIDNAGHMVIIEQPDAVVDHLTSWLACHP